MTMKLSSPAFPDGGVIPPRHARKNQDLSPPLSWSGAPEGTEAFALVVRDPDAPRGDYVHWVLYDLPGDMTSLPEAVPTDRELASGARQGINDYRAIGWGGPAPPSGTHRYFFRLFALNAPLGLPAGASVGEVEMAMKGRVRAEAVLTGTYAHS